MPCLKEYRNKALCILYLILVASLAIGWYPESEAKNICLVTENIGDMAETMCLIEENNGLFRQDVRETGEEERRQNEQLDESHRRAARTVEKKKKKSKAVFGVSESSRKILERIVEAEAGDQDVKGRVLVANVILNRVKSKQFPNTVKAVVFAPRQFSPVSNGSYDSVHVSETTKKAVERALQGEDFSKGALYFMCRSASNPRNVSWFDRDLTRLFSYGCHEFFR